MTYCVVLRCDNVMDLSYMALMYAQVTELLTFHLYVAVLYRYPCPQLYDRNDYKKCLHLSLSSVAGFLR